MVLPFVRELLADVEQTPAFARAAAALRNTPGGPNGAGRTRLAGLTPAAKALHLALLQRASGKPLLIVVADNRAAEELTAALAAFCELTGAASPELVVHLPAIDVLPYENLSPHPEIQEKRASALVKIAGGAAAIVVAPIVATAMRLRRSDFYAGLGRTIRKGGLVDIEELARHLS
ncbi:MAG TPA: transcription-repair coupling factor, partial [Terriglobales bacterium]|nr:transcription-repair coupling factor [Terriglobales bacterium]